MDGFQGHEKEAVLVSLVCSKSALRLRETSTRSAQDDIGFLAETRRMNVALTRARRKLIVIGVSATITAHPFYEKMVKYFKSVGAFHSVWEE